MADRVGVINHGGRHPAGGGQGRADGQARHFQADADLRRPRWTRCRRPWPHGKLALAAGGAALTYSYDPRAEDNGIAALMRDAGRGSA